MKQTLFCPDLGKNITCIPVDTEDDGSRIWERENETEYQFARFRIKSEKDKNKYVFFVMNELQW